MHTPSVLALLALTVACATDPAPPLPVEQEPEVLDLDDDGWLDDEDCDDARADVNPGAEELENAIDDNCDGRIDEGTDAYDDDLDGWSEHQGDCDDSDASIAPDADEIAYDGLDQNCDGLDLLDVDGDGHDSELVGGEDCDDEDPETHPGAEELANAIDDDCDGELDEGTENADDDGDGWSEVDGDCDDTDPDRSPEAEEIAYDGIDNDCDGLDDRDLDGDHHDAESVGGRDCDDTDPSVHAGATETPYDGIDQDCDGADLIDVDGDGEAALSAGGLDCDDNNSAMAPGLAEVADYLDNDCNGSVDEQTDYGDDDGDGYAEIDGDCDDDQPLASPGLSEIPGDGIDNDCDFLQDEQLLSETTDSLLRDVSNGTLFGSVLAAGDFDGDGSPDLAIGAPNGDDSATDAGEVWVVPAEAFGQSPIENAASFSILGSASSDALGSSMASVPDLDGDGAPELLLGAPGAASAASNDGAVYLLYSQSTSDLVLDESAEDILDVLGTGQNNSRGGNTVAAGDLNGDGLADIVVGSPTVSSSKGKAWITEGLVGGEGGYGTFDMGQGGFASILGADSNDELAGELAVLGDLDGDGYGELALTATGEGAVYLFDGHELESDLTSSESGLRIEGPSKAFGALTAADLDNDGDLDLIGADENNGITVFLNDGFGWSGNLRNSDADVLVGSAGQDLGASLALSDLDGDGTLDLLLGAPGNNQETTGGGAIWTTDASLLLAADGLAIEAITSPILGDTENAAAGASLVIGDGFWATGGETTTNAGRAWLVLID